MELVLSAFLDPAFEQVLLDVRQVLIALRWRHHFVLIRAGDASPDLT